SRSRFSGHQLSLPTWVERIKNIFRKVAFVGVIGTVFYWMVKLFDLEISKKHVIKSKITFSKGEFFDAIEKATPIAIWIGLGSLCIEILRAFIGCIMERDLVTKVWSILLWFVFSFAALGMFAISLVPYTDIDYATQQKVWPVIKRLKHKTDYLELVHAYGLFRSMTGVGGRPEVIVEGSNSLEGPWKEYDFLYKPGILDKRLPVVVLNQTECA
ncbi:lipase maturation factor 2-like, partial [Actinia tenebrosa]|uniref:Lipase maturation factor 2 n=1 Tax=Actinia tenebrosa TaxID=6105 RepID=A0A6P8H9A7_ACTTE